MGGSLQFQNLEERHQKTFHMPNFQNQQESQLKSVRLARNAQVQALVDETDKHRARSTKRTRETGQTLKQERDAVKRQKTVEKRESYRAMP